MDHTALREQAVLAALAVGANAGHRSTDHIVLQDSNNVVVWLAPHAVIAKVGVWPHSTEVLDREVQVAARLAVGRAPVAAPIGLLATDDRSGLPVSLWTRLVSTGPSDAASAGDLAVMLHRVHDAAGAVDLELPSFLDGIDFARARLDDNAAVQALAAADRDLLRSAMDRWAQAVRDHAWEAQALHGEPHLGNVIVTADGPHLVDFEAAAIGPIEWDLASLPPAVATAYGPIDAELLETCRLLNSARVAVWGWDQADLPPMRSHGEHHLAVVRHALQR